MSHDLVDGDRRESIGYAAWFKLRVTARGFQVLDEWPNLKQLAAAESVQAVLAGVAQGSSDAEERGTLRGAAGVVASLGEGIVQNVLTGVTRDLGQQAGDRQ